MNGDPRTKAQLQRQMIEDTLDRGRSVILYCPGNHICHVMPHPTRARRLAQ